MANFTSTDFIDSQDKCIIAVYQQLGIDLSDNDIIFCQEFIANDYYQVFTISLIMYLIYLGMYLLPFSSYSSYAKAISEARSTLTSSEGVQNLRLTIDESNERDLNLGRYNGMPFILYLFLHSLLSICYLLIKFILILNPFDDNYPNDNRYEDVNDRFEEDGFKKFVNGETIILTYLLSHNISNVTKISKVYFMKQALYPSLFKKIICIILLIIIWIDFIASFIILCIFWSLLIFFLYEIAVGIVIAFILILSCCFTVPCLVCLIMLNMSLFTICGKNNKCSTFLITFGSCIIFAMFGYLILCLLITFLFLFVGGASQSVIYLNGDNQNHMAVLILFIIATGIGLISVIIGSICSCLDPSQHQSLPNKDEVDNL